MKLEYQIALFASLFVAACGQQPPEGDFRTSTAETRISGVVAYRESLALPPGATMVATLYDTHSDEAGEELAERTIVTDGAQVPIPFDLTLDRSLLNERSRYSIRVQIRAANGELLWITDTAHDLPGKPDGDTVAIGTLILVRAAGDRVTQTTAGKLTETEWVVEDIDGRGIVDSSRVTVLLSADGRISGRATCNSYTGSYDLDSEGFRARDIAVTNRACVEALARQEAEFLRILRSASGTSTTDDGALVISNPSGESLIARRS